jgi:hypothetical protein
MSKKLYKNSSLKKKKGDQGFLREEKGNGLPSLQNDKILRVIASLVFLFVLYVRIRLLSTPLERDEGEYAYMGQLLLKGIIPFKEAYNMKFPGTSMMYSIIMFIFGQNTVGIHTGLLLINAGSVFFLFLLYRRWSDSKSNALIASSIFAFLSINPAFLGFAAHATHFVMFFSLAGLVLLYRAFSKSRIMLYFFSGLMFGLAVLMKQPAVFFVLFGIILIGKQYVNKSLQTKELIKYSIIFITGFLIPLILLVVILKIGGTFDRFWFWTIQYGAQYGSIVTLEQGIEMFKHTFMHIFSQSYLFWILAVAGLFLLVINNRRKHGKLEIILFSAASFMAILPGFYFRKHYFIMLLPSVSILVVEGLFYLTNKIKIKNYSYNILIMAFIAIILWTLLSNSSYYLSDSSELVVQKTYGMNPFNESIPISEFIASRTDPDDRIQVLGSEPEIYFYSKRMAASGHMYMYGLMEPQKYSSIMQQELINDLARIKPKYIVFCNIRNSWLARTNSDDHILNWSRDFIYKNYNIVGVVDIGEETIYKWMDEAVTYKPSSQNFIYIFERKRS